VVCTALSALTACGGRSRETGRGEATIGRTQAEAEYRFLQSEIALASTDSLYLLIDFARRETALKRRGTPLWSCPMRSPHGDPDGVDFSRRFLGEEGRSIRVVAWKHLYGGQEKIPAQTLEIVSRTLNADPASLQRLLPERFLLSFGDRAFMEVRTDVEGSAVGGLENQSKSVERTVDIILGGASLDLSMTGEQGLTLYEAVYPGMPVLLVPPPAR
jgi:hypothetical protein